MKKLLFIVISFLLSSMSYGQNRSDLLKKINEIKKMNDVYYWNQYTHPDADTARVNAMKWVLLEVNSTRSESDQLSLGDISPFVKFIKIDRGYLTQYFVYMKKDYVGSPQINQQVATIASPSPVIEKEQERFSKSFVPDAFVQRLIQQKTFYSVYNFLKTQKTQGEILQFGPLKEVEDYSSLDLILFDMQSKELLTVLSPVVQGDVRTNMVTGMKDSLENYPEDMVLVIWYIK